jgi:hypothetical protein
MNASTLAEGTQRMKAQKKLREWAEIAVANFTNLLCAVFWYKSFALSFFALRKFRLVLFCRNNIIKKAALKMLVKLTSVVNFTIILPRSTRVTNWIFFNYSFRMYFFGGRNWAEKLLIICW